MTIATARRDQKRTVNMLAGLASGPLAEQTNTISERVALLVLDTATDDLRMSELGARVGLSRAAVTSLVDRFERMGWAARTPHPSDRRVMIVQITDAGRALVADALDALVAGRA